MAIEVEHKFLVKGEFAHLARQKKRIIQGYLSSVPGRSVRVRIQGDRGYLTIKGLGNAGGNSRYEWEKEIGLQEAEELLKLCEPGVIDKVRYEVVAGQTLFVIDEFFGDNQGLVIAEVELQAEGDHFERPDWLGEEVTGDVRYYNSMLKKRPFKTWGDFSG